MDEDRLEDEIERHLERQYDSFGLSLDLDEEMDTGYLCITFEKPVFPSVGKYAEKITQALEITDSEIKADYQPEEGMYELKISQASETPVPR
jgi:frataxin-like iron-binding protein CyaY